MKIWVTGIDGFLGHALHEELSKLGHVVTGNDNHLCSANPIGNHIFADCRDFGRMDFRLRDFKPDILFHCAATAHEGLSNFSPSFITKNIYEASVATFSAAIKNGVKRIIYMSSMARYGAQTLPFHEVQTPKPVDPYGIAKVAAEQTLAAMCKMHDVEFVIAVPHNIIGPGQRYCDPYRNVASIMINKALKGEPIIVYGDGKQRRCFSPIDDCMHSLIKMIDAPISGEVINIGPDRGDISILELAEMIRELTGGTAEILHVEDRPNEVKEAYCTSSKARKFLDFEPQSSLEKCIKSMVAHIQKNGTKEFRYDFPIEIQTKKTPKTWTEKMI